MSSPHIPTHNLWQTTEELFQHGKPSMARRLLKKANLLTRPTPANISPARPESAKTASSPWDAPCPKQGRSQRPKMVFQACSCTLPSDGPDESPTVRCVLTRPPTGRYFSPALPSDCFVIDFPRRAISSGEGLLTFPLLPQGSSQTVLHCAHRTSTVSSCAFCEHKGWSGCPPPSF